MMTHDSVGIDDPEVTIRFALLLANSGVFDFVFRRSGNPLIVLRIVVIIVVLVMSSFRSP